MLLLNYGVIKDMLELWGHPVCDSCEDVKKLLGRTPLEWKPMTVGKDFTGMIPFLYDDETGERIEGYPGIKIYIEKKLREMGFSEGMF